MEQEEYAKEKIIWQNIKFIDNQNVLDLIGQKPCNIMSLIDEESKFPKGTDATLLLKLNANHGTKSIYVRPVCDHASSFGIQHFAGVVMYNTKGAQFISTQTFENSMEIIVIFFFHRRFAREESRHVRNGSQGVDRTVIECFPVEFIH